MKRQILIVLSVLFLAQASAAQTLRSGDLSATLDPQGILTLKKGGTTWLTASFAMGDKIKFEAVDLATGTPFGEGQMLADHASSDRILLLKGSPFVYLRRDARNRPVAPPSKSINALEATLQLDTPATSLVCSGPNGLFKADHNQGQHLFTAIADPADNRGVVAGIVTIDAVSPVVFTDIKGGKVRLTLQDQYGTTVPSTMSAFGGDWWVIGYFDDARVGLEWYADEFARINQLEMKRCPVGLMTWYCEKYGGCLNQEAVVEISEFIAKTFGDYGYDFIQIDDLWQAGLKSNGPAKDFSKVRPNGPYKDGMKGPAHKIRALGLTPGLWLLPFGTNPDDPALQHTHPFLVKTPHGGFFTTNWSGTSIDSSHPDGQAYVREMMHRAVKDWGYDYLKLDGIHMAMATRQTYPNRAFVQDEFGDAVFHNKDISNMQVGRLGLDAIREGAGPDTFILGCASTQNERSLAMCLGKFDAMRVGPDSSRRWSGRYSIIEGVRSAASLYFQNGRTWWLDPDSIYARKEKEFPDNEVRCFASFVTISGMLNNMTDWAPDYPADRIDLLRRTMPSHQLTSVRPLDYFRNDPARIWHLTYPVGDTTGHTLGIFNWTDDDFSFDVPLTDLGIKSHGPIHTFEFWSQSHAQFSGSINGSLPARSCLVFAVNPETKRPAVLSTSGHITQGAVDLVDVVWSNKTLSGTSKIVAEDSYEIRIANNGAKLTAVDLDERAETAGVTAALKQDATLTRIVLRSPETREVNWLVR